MANSIEARLPFLDHRLVEFSTQLPADYLDATGELKKIMLNGLKYIIPKSILDRKDKIGFITSEENWVKKQYSKEFREMLEQSIAASKGIIKPEALLYFDKVVAGTVPFTYNYWRFIQFGLWMKKFNVALQ
jgi:asparagine synthase (glutamine-hydrolysing)